MKSFVPKIERPFTVRGTEIRPDETPEQYLQKLARITLDGMFQLVGVLTTDGILLECNRAALVAGRADTGRRHREAVLGETYWWTCSTKTQEDLRNAIARTAKGESVRYDTEVYGRKGGTETWNGR
jgi:PAS fold